MEDQQTIEGKRTRARRGRGTRGMRTTAGAELATAAPQAPEAGVHRVAILDSDSGFLLVLGNRLERGGWHHQVLPAKAPLKALIALDVDALVIDVELFGEERLRTIGRLCQERPDLSVIVCTGPSTVAERVQALRLGVDDWMTKPCHPEELIARMESGVHSRVRSRKVEPSRIGEVDIRPDQYQAFVGEQSLGLTRREYQLIELLDGARGEILPRERIYECLWGYEMIRNDRSVDVFVHKLRRKLEQASPEWAYIHTHFGVGYRLAAVRLDAEAAPEPLAA